MTNEERPLQWWILSPDDDGGDLKHLRKAVESKDWAVFADELAQPDGPPPVAMTLARSADGRMICTGLIIGLNDAYPVGDGRGSFGVPVEITSRTLRGIPVAELIGRAVTADSAPERHSPFRQLVLGRAPDGTTVRRAPGPKGHPDEHFEMVASMYRQALAESPRRPMAWLTERLNADRTTVARWVQRARDKGYLGEAQPGRAGETKEKGRG